MTDKELEKWLMRLISDSILLKARVETLQGTLMSLIEQKQIDIPPDFWEKFEEIVASRVQSALSTDPALDESWRDFFLKNL